MHLKQPLGLFFNSWPLSVYARSQWKVEKCTDCHLVHCSVNKSIKNLTGNTFPKISSDVCEQILKNSISNIL